LPDFVFTIFVGTGIIDIIYLAVLCLYCSLTLASFLLSE